MFVGLTQSDFACYEARKWKSNVYNRERLEGSISARRDRLPSVAEGATSPESVPSRSTSATQSAPAPRCDGVCQAAQEICRFSRRICLLSEQIADEPSQRSCKRADRECGTASSLCASCR